MQKENTSVIRIRTLGVLELRIGEEDLFTEKVPSGKLLQLFLILAWAGEKGIGRLKLQDYLYDRSSANAANGLRILMSRLRKCLRASRLPEDTYVINRGYFYYLGGHLSVEMDAVQMEHLYRAAQEESGEKRILLLEKACRLYQGEFLPSFSGEFWAESMRSHYQNIYFESVRQLCADLSESGEWRRALVIVGGAVRLYPAMEEWSGLQSRFIQQIGEEVLDTDEDIEALSAGLLADDTGDGAYFCTLSGFTDCIRMAVREAEKKERYLVSWFLVERQTESGRRKKRQMEYMKHLQGILEETLDREDVYTVCGSGRALLLAGDAEKRLPELKRAVVSGLRKRCGADISVKMQWADVRELKKNMEKEKKSKIL